MDHNKKILITGSSGTIGTRLSEKLLEKGYEVFGVDRRPNLWSEKINSLTTLADLRQKEDLEKIPKDVDLVIHLAANARVYNLVVDPSLARDNFETVFNTLDFCRKNNIKKFLFASSREVYGNSDKIVHKEDDSKVELCESTYTASKIAGEAMARAYGECYGTEIVIVRFSNVYGMYDESDRLIPLYIKSLKEGKDLIVFGKDKLLDFTYIDDAVSGVIRCIELFPEIKKEVFNIATGEGSTILEVAETIKREMNSQSEIILKDNRTGEVVKYIADISKAKRILGYSPKTSLCEGVKKSIDWYLKNLYL
jgi:nucleoside-diphosphate-sugar epimerase